MHETVCTQSGVGTTQHAARRGASRPPWRVSEVLALPARALFYSILKQKVSILALSLLSSSRFLQVHFFKNLSLAGALLFWMGQRAEVDSAKIVAKLKAH